MKSFVLEFFITACFVNLAVSLPQYQFASHMFPAVNTVYRRYFPENPPARIFINVPAWYGGFDIEVDCIAAVL
jgi:enamine deaminase RidA (YjgF/YER057c/UK114 family)